MKQLLLIGPYCEIGGVSIHVRRLEKLLHDDFSIKIIDESKLRFNDGKTYNLRKGNLFKYFKLIFNSDIIHIHTSINWLRLIHILLCKLLLKKVILTIHSLTHVKTRKELFFLKIAVIISNKVICVNNQIKIKLKELDMVVMHAFLPPILSYENDLPQELIYNLKLNKKNRIVVSNAYRLVLHNEQDLYGFDLLIDVARKIKTNADNIKIILVVSSVENCKELLFRYISLINKENLEDFITIIPYSISFVKLIQKSDLVVRATNTDGDALTIRESLFFNKPVVASDVIERPKGTVLFKNRDSMDLYLKIKENIDNSNDVSERFEIDYKEFYRDLYII